MSSAFSSEFSSQFATAPKLVSSGPVTLGAAAGQAAGASVVVSPMVSLKADVSKWAQSNLTAAKRKALLAILARY